MNTLNLDSKSRWRLFKDKFIITFPKPSKRFSNAACNTDALSARPRKSIQQLARQLLQKQVNAQVQGIQRFPTVKDKVSKSEACESSSSDVVEITPLYTTPCEPVLKTTKNASVSASINKKTNTRDVQSYSHAESDKSEREKRKDEQNDEDIDFFNSILPHIVKFTAQEKLLFRITVLQIIKDIGEKKHKVILTSFPNSLEHNGYCDAHFH